MAETIVSPGVFTNEVDQSYIQTGVSRIGAAIIGPTQKGPAGIPTVVSSYSEFLQKFGGAFTSGSGASEKSYKYLTNYAVQEYLKYGDAITVVRILAGTYTPATSSVNSSGGTSVNANLAFTFSPTRPTYVYASASVETNGIRIETPAGGLIGAFVSGSNSYFNTTMNYGEFNDGPAGLVSLINNNAELSSQLSASYTGSTFSLTASVAGSGSNGITVFTGSYFQIAINSPAAVSAGVLANGTDQSAVVFTLTTLSDGADQNSLSTESTNGLLPSGSINNLRWEVTSRNTTKGTFNLSIRRGDDTNNRKIILEQYNNLTLDPNSPNYIAKIIGDQYYTLADSGTTDPYLQLTGDYPNKSKLVRVTVHQNTINYLDANGDVRDSSLSYLIPAVASGSFGGGSDGTVTHPISFNENISNTNTQGFNLGVAGSGKNAYIDAIRVLKNQDEYDINVLVLPGLVDNFSNHATVLTEAVNMVESRGDCFLVIDPVEYGAALTTATNKAGDRDSSYVAEYWPWVKIPDTDLGRSVWVPVSTLIPSVYAFNDRVSAPWYAPAGLNRGGLDIVTQTERKLTQANRDTLSEANLNAIATFPNEGVVAFGQKTLQKKASALDRINVRRLLIAAKKFIASTTKYLVFENNTSATRNAFLAIANPYFENVQQRNGLYRFRVIMDETNNTNDVIDRNEMRGAIYLQPAKTAEMIIIDFNIQATGASFPE